MCPKPRRFRGFVPRSRENLQLTKFIDQGLGSREHEIPTIESGALRAIDARTALAALAEIEESYRAAVELFYLADLSYKEIAGTLGVPIGTVMSRLSRGKELTS